MQIQTNPEYPQTKAALGAATKKVLTILMLTLVLIMPLALVENQVTDRRGYESIAQQDVARGWGESVALRSPVVSTSGKNLYPDLSETTLIVDSQEKKRGVFQVPVYLATLRTKVVFNRPPVAESGAARTETEPDRLFLAVKPVSAIQHFKITDIATGKELKGTLSDGGIRLPIQQLVSFYSSEIQIEVAVRGTGPLTYESSADQDKVRMVGNWPKPKFIDDLLPTETKLSAKGFEASWTINALAKQKDGTRDARSIGLTHLWVGTDYTMVERAVKYGILFIALTFLLMLTGEFIARLKIHPLQYGLVGLAISLFYLLLLAISEVSSFNIAYFVSSFAVTSLIVFYIRGFMRQKKFIGWILTEQITLSGFFYVLLSLEERAFLVGSLGLFLALTIFMTVTRRFDWYSGSFKAQTEN